MQLALHYKERILDISLAEKMIARHLETVFRCRPRIIAHYEDAGSPFRIGMARVSNYPAPGLATVATVGTSNSRLFQADGSEHPATRVEFIASCRDGQEDDLVEALFLAACFVGKRGGAAEPCIFLNDLLGRFRPSSPVPHGFLTTPFAYEDILSSRDFAGRRVTWLQVVPVSTREVAYARTHSTGALESLFEAQGVEWDDLDRGSVV
ncbi:MAG: suppressor of fused domain protein [Alphaproteobacteria bacterium]|nr:MAG: suppressor of fused domain protein [Alphaproteobacteria bacterium]